MSDTHDCGNRCRSKQHCLDLISAIIRGTPSQAKAYLTRCHNFATSKDSHGRSLLHVAASVGKWQIVQWLLDLEVKKTDINYRDLESGWTALHRALFYGQLHCAQILVANGASITSRDHEGLTAFDLVSRDTSTKPKLQSDESDTYTWGDNVNFTLGHVSGQKRPYPEQVDIFKRNKISIEQVVLCKYHTLFRSTSGQIYTCGHAQGGRLGHGNQQTCLEPKLIESLKKEVCVQVAAGRDHSVFLTASNKVYSCGLNQCKQLGLTNPSSHTSSCLLPKQLNTYSLKGQKIEGICAGRQHTVIYTHGGLYTFGLNAGQLGHQKGDKYVSSLRQVSALNHKDFVVKTVTCSDAATICVSGRGDIYVLHEYQCRKIAASWLNMRDIKASGGSLDQALMSDVVNNKGGTELIIAVLSSDGKVFIWQEEHPVLKCCLWSLGHQLHVYVSSIALGASKLGIITRSGGGPFGEGYIGQIPSGNQQKHNVSTVSRKYSESRSEEIHNEDFPSVTLQDLIDDQDIQDVQLKQIPYTHRGVYITCDSKGLNYAVIQCQPVITHLPDVDKSTMCQNIRSLYEEADITDNMHDVIIKINQRTFPVHKYILASRSNYFRSVLLDNDNQSVITLEDTTNVDIFLQLLMFIYSDTCDFLSPGFRLHIASDMSQNINSNNTSMNFGYLPNETSSDLKLSAYAVRQKKAELDGESHDSHKHDDPVKQLLDMAKSFKVKDLVKRLELLKYDKGYVIYRAPKGGQLPQPRLIFDRNKLSELCDVCIRSEDGMDVWCHKCILVSRLEYFQKMLACGWIEEQKSEDLNLPVPGAVVLAVVEYLYTDECKLVVGSKDIETIVNILVVADQLLVTGLRQVCEVSLAKLLNLKNAGEMLELACTYNAEQLKNTCQQFIVSHIPALLESRTLDVLSVDVMQDLTNYYRSYITAMERRMITPYSTGPNSDDLELLTFNNESTSITKDKETIKKSKRKRRTSHSGATESSLGTVSKDTRRKKTLSESSKLSAEDAVWENNTSPRTTAEHNNANTTEEEFSSKQLKTGNLQTNNIIQADQSNIMQDNKNLVDRQTVDTAKQNSVKVTPVSFKKLSQKERKNQQRKDNENLAQNMKPAKTWGNVNTMVESFADLMLNDKEEITVKQPEFKVKSPSSADHLKVSYSWGLPDPVTRTRKSSSSGDLPVSPTSPTSPTDNPWQKTPSKSSKKLNFTDIMQAEVKMETTRDRAANKHLKLIQIEERAIQELLDMYGATEAKDEYITVERVTDVAAEPSWAAHVTHK